MRSFSSMLHNLILVSVETRLDRSVLDRKRSSRMRFAISHGFFTGWDNEYMLIDKISFEIDLYCFDKASEWIFFCCVSF